MIYSTLIQFGLFFCWDWASKSKSKSYHTHLSLNGYGSTATVGYLLYRKMKLKFEKIGFHKNNLWLQDGLNMVLVYKDETQICCCFQLLFFFFGFRFQFQFIFPCFGFIDLPCNQQVGLLIFQNNHTNAEYKNNDPFGNNSVSLY